MARWMISYRKDNNTSILSMPSGHKPSMQEAERYLLEWARRNLEKGEYGAAHETPEGDVTDALLRLYGITITGITRE